VTRLSVVLATVVVATGVAGIPPSGSPHVASRELPLGVERAVAGVARTVDDVGVGAEMVGLLWDGATHASFEVRGFTGGSWTPWIRVDGSPDEGPDASSDEYRATGGAGPVWLGHDIRRVQVRTVGGEAHRPRLVAIDTEPPRGDGPLSIAGAEAVPAWPALLTRAQWGADESWRTVNCSGNPSYAREVRFGVVHHTASSNDYAPADSASLMRGIYYFHVFGRGWCDIAYNFLVDRYGTVFEGRAGGINRPVLGGHTGGFNSGSTGVSVIGDFTSSPVPTAAYAGVRRILAWKLGYHGVDPHGWTTEVAGDSPTSRWPEGTVVTLPNIEGHTDSNNTSCPGAYLYALLPKLRDDVAADIAASRDQRLTCDWDGDGDETPAFYIDGRWYIRNGLGEAFPDLVLDYGTRGYVPVCGDWDGDGDDTIGVYDRGTWYLRNSNSPGPPNITVQYGTASYTPVVGDWDGTLPLVGGKGTDTIGVFDGGTWYLRNSNTPGLPQLSFRYGVAGYRPVAGDWDGDGDDTIGVSTYGYWYLRNENSAGAPHVAFGNFGWADDTPVAGDWNDDGRDTAGLARGAYWILSNSTTEGSANHVFPY
jgi:hypothetical protein